MYTSAGVPQGGVLSLLLIAFFINSITFKLHNSYHLYADDLRIYTHSPIDDLSHAIHWILNMNFDWYLVVLDYQPTRTEQKNVWCPQPPLGDSVIFWRMPLKLGLHNPSCCILDNAGLSYPDLTELRLDKPERLHNVCIRFMFVLRKYDYISEFHN